MESSQNSNTAKNLTLHPPCIYRRMKKLAPKGLMTRLPRPDATTLYDPTFKTCGVPRVFKTLEMLRGRPPVDVFSGELEELQRAT